MANDPRPAPHILIVDDDPNLRVMYTVLLQGAGYETVAAGSAERALERFDDGPVDLVLTDLAMPGAGGLGLVETLSRRRPQLPIVAMSGDPSLLDRARAAGACSALGKPLPIRRLLETIERALSPAPVDVRAA